MKKLLLLIPLIFLFSCETEEEERPCLLEGVWELNYEEFLQTGYTDCYCEYSNTNCDETWTECGSITFSENGDVYYLDPPEGNEYNGQWSGGCMAGDTIFVSIEAETFPLAVIVSINNNNLILDDGNGYRGYCTRLY